MTIQIKRVGPEDAVLFRDVAAEVFDEAVSDQTLIPYLAEPAHKIVVALAGGTIIGQAAAVIHRHPDKPAELYVDEVGVTPTFQGQGIGRRMLEELSAWGRELGCASLWVGTEVDNERAKALYARYAEPEPFVMYQWKL